MQVKAVRQGYDGVKRRREDEVFDWPKGLAPGSWVEPIEGTPKAEAADFNRERERAEHARLQRQAVGATSQPESPGSKK